MGDVRSRGQKGSGADRLRLRLLTHIGDPRLYPQRPVERRKSD